MKMRKKADLPHKACAACGLPFTWRRKWARDWESVKYCSERCRRGGGNAPVPASVAEKIRTVKDAIDYIDKHAKGGK